MPDYNMIYNPATGRMEQVPAGQQPSGVSMILNPSTGLVEPQPFVGPGQPAPSQQPALARNPESPVNVKKADEEWRRAEAEEKARVEAERRKQLAASKPYRIKVQGYEPAELGAEGGIYTMGGYKRPVSVDEWVVPWSTQYIVDPSFTSGEHALSEYGAPLPGHYDPARGLMVLPFSPVEDRMSGVLEDVWRGKTGGEQYSRSGGHAPEELMARRVEEPGVEPGDRSILDMIMPAAGAQEAGKTGYEMSDEEYLARREEERQRGAYGVGIETRQIEGKWYSLDDLGRWVESYSIRPVTDKSLLERLGTSDGDGAAIINKQIDLYNKIAPIVWAMLNRSQGLKYVEPQNVWDKDVPLVGGGEPSAYTPPSQRRGVGSLERANPIDAGNDPLGILGWIIPRHSTLREIIAPDTFEPLLTHKLSDEYYKTSGGRSELDAWSNIMAFGMIGTAPEGLGAGVSLTKDIIPRLPVVREAYKSTVDFASPLVRSVSAGLNKIGMAREVQPVYDISVYGSGVARKLEPAVTPALDLSRTTRIPKGATDIVESELSKTAHSVYGGGAAGAQYKYTIPRISRDIDAFVNEPELIGANIKAMIGKKPVLGVGDITDLHAFPSGYPVKGARYTLSTEYEAQQQGLMLGTRLLGDPIPKIPDASDIVTGRGLTYEQLNYLAVRKYNAMFEDIAGIENPLTKASEVSRLSNRLGKDALDVQAHMTELLMAEEARGGVEARVSGRVMSDLEKIYARPIKINIGGVESRTTVGELARGESLKYARPTTGKIGMGVDVDDLIGININLERPAPYGPGILQKYYETLPKKISPLAPIEASIIGSGVSSTSRPPGYNKKPSSSESPSLMKSLETSSPLRSYTTDSRVSKSLKTPPPSKTPLPPSGIDTSTTPYPSTPLSYISTTPYPYKTPPPSKTPLPPSGISTSKPPSQPPHPSYTPYPSETPQRKRKKLDDVESILQARPRRKGDAYTHRNPLATAEEMLDLMGFGGR